MVAYVLDTSALIALIDKEEGVETVKDLLRKSLKNEINIYISIVSTIEIFYVTWQNQGEKRALERLKMLNDLAVVQEPLDSNLTTLIGELKATNRMSFADCCIAALAKWKKATLVHKDPEFEQIEEDHIKQLQLPYK